MLTIPRALHDQIVAHARRDHPDEACGVLAGPAGTDRPERFIPMTNSARSPTFYEFDSTELFRVWREMDDRDEEPVSAVAGGCQAQRRPLHRAGPAHRCAPYPEHRKARGRLSAAAARPRRY